MNPTRTKRNNLLAALTAASLLLALLWAGGSSAQGGFVGDYDTAFSPPDGYYVDPEVVDATEHDGAVQTLFFTGGLLPDGSVIAGGRHVNRNRSNGDFYLRKFTPSGAVDTTFGTGGFVRTTFHTRYDGVPGNDLPQVLKVQPDGKILFAGYCIMLEPNASTAQFGADACVMRYNPDGTLDPTFGGGTIVYTSQGNTYDHSTTLDPGKVIIQSGAISSGQSFGTNGTVYDIEVQPDGKILLAGETKNYASFWGTQTIIGFVARLNTDGSLDGTFGSGGIARWAAPEGPAAGCFPSRRFFGLRLQADGRILAVGHGEITRSAAEPCAYGERFAVTRWTAAGVLETVSHIDDLANVDVFFTERAVSAHFARDGKLLVSGSARNRSGSPAGRQKPTLVRMNVADLSLDTSFGSGGVAQYDVAWGSYVGSTFRAQAIQPDGKILGTDNAFLPGNYVRLNPDGTGDDTFGNQDIDSVPGGLGRLRVFVMNYNGVNSQLEAGQLLLRPNGKINLVAHSAAHSGLAILRAVVSQNTAIPESADLELTKSASPDPAFLDRVLTYTINVTNHGPLDAAAVKVVDNLPSPGITFLSATPSQGTCTRSGATLTCQLGDLWNGASASIVVKIRPRVTGTLTNTATASSQTPDAVSTNNSVTIQTPVVVSTDLSITKTASKNPALVNQIFAYNLQVTNLGPAAANNVTAVDQLPSGISFVSATPSQGTCAHASGTVTCHFGALAVGANATAVLKVKAREAGALSNTATVSATEADHDTSNNSATVQTSAILSADLSVKKRDSADPVLLGQQFTYTLTVANAGFVAATGVVVTDTLPASMAFVSASASQGSITSAPPAGSSGTVVASLGNMAVGATATVAITVEATQPGSFTNAAAVAGDQSDHDTTNNTHKQTTTVVTLSKLLLSASSVRGGCLPHPTGTVYLTGPAPAGGVTVSLSSTIPAATTPASVLIPAGATKSAAFTVTTSSVGAAQSGQIKATLGSKTVGRGLSVMPGACP